MKKLFAIILMIVISPITALAEGALYNIQTDVTSNKKIALHKRQTTIEDEFINSDNFPKIMPEYIKNDEPITDELINSYQQSGATIKLWARKRGEYKKTNINDEFASSPSFISKVGNVSILKRQHKEIIEDNLAKNNLKIKDVRMSKAKNIYDFSKAQIPIKLKVIKNLTTKHQILEGDSILFKTVEDITIGDETLPKGTKIIGRVETISKSDKMGTPANIVIDNFYVENNPDICFYGHISKTGANRSIWVYPLYQAGNIMFYVAGFVFVPIHGGHAKITPNETYTVFYETK